MRREFVQTLSRLAEKDSRVLLLTGDLGFMVLEPFQQEFPERFINVGVSEQNMIGIATGLAEAGNIPFVYSIATFAALRAYEFIRNGPIVHNFKVRIVGIGDGFEYGSAGFTHHNLEDVGVMRVQRGIQVIVPGDVTQVRKAIESTYDSQGPIYYRLSKDDKITANGLNGRFSLNEVEIIKDGGDVLILTMGSMSVEAIKVAEKVKDVSISIGVVSSFNPGPERSLIDLLKKFKRVITLEAHSKNGALGSLVSELIAENGINSRLKRIGVENTPDSITGNDEFLKTKNRISADEVASTIEGFI